MFGGRLRWLLAVIPEHADRAEILSVTSWACLGQAPYARAERVPPPVPAPWKKAPAADRPRHA